MNDNLRGQVGRQYFDDDWHCGNHGCGCWLTKDIERDKDMLMKIIKGLGSFEIDVHYHEYHPGKDEGKEATDRYIYTVTLKEKMLEGFEPYGWVSVYGPTLYTAMFHGFMLTGASAQKEKGKPTLSLDFERVGIYKHETS